MNSLLARSSMIAVVLATFFALGQWLRPQPAEADVVQRFGMQLASLADFLALDARPGGQRLIRINGQVMYSELSSSSRTPAEILDELEARAQIEYAALDLEPTTEAIREGRELTYLFRRPFRTQGDGWGAFGRLTAGPLTSAASLIGPLASGGGLGESAAGGFVVLALREAEAEESDVWTLRFERGFDPLAFAVPTDRDVPGDDLPGIERFPGSRRALRLTESASTGVTHVVAYEGAGSVDGHAHHYASALVAAGLRLTNTSRRDARALLQFSGAGVLVDVFLSRADGSGAPVLDLIQMRPL